MINFWDERYYVVVIFPLQKMTKMSSNSYSEHLEKITESAQNPENASEQSCEITESDPKLSDFADQSLSRTDMSSFGFLWFLALWSTNLDPNSTPNIRPKSPIILGGKLGLETQVLGVGCSPKTPPFSSSPSLPPFHSHFTHISLSPSTFFPPSMPQ